MENGSPYFTDKQNFKILNFIINYILKSKRFTGSLF